MSTTKNLLVELFVEELPPKVQQVRTAPPVVKPGAQQDKGKVEARSDLKQFREAGRKGEHRTQEQLLEKMLGRAFK